MNGANLLHLLEKHGYKMRIDLKEAKKLLLHRLKQPYPQKTLYPKVFSTPQRFRTIHGI